MPLPCVLTQVSFSHLDKLEVIQNKAARLPTDSDLKSTVSYFGAKTGVLLFRAHPELCSQQFYASALHPNHPSNLSHLHPPPLMAILHASYNRVLRGLRARGDEPNAPLLPVIFGAYTDSLARRPLQGRIAGEIVRSQAPNKVLCAIPPPVDPAEQLLPRCHRSALSQLLLLLPKAPGLQPLCRLSWRPYMPRLSLYSCIIIGALSLVTSHTSLAIAQELLQNSSCVSTKFAGDFISPHQGHCFCRSCYSFDPLIFGSHLPPHPGLPSYTHPAMELLYDFLVPGSHVTNSMVPFIHASITRPWSFLQSLVLLSCNFNLLQAATALLFLCPRSSFQFIHELNIPMFSAVSSPNLSLSSLLSLHFSSNLPIISPLCSGHELLLHFFLVSDYGGIICEERNVISTSTASLFSFSHLPVLEKELPCTHFHLIPVSIFLWSASSFLFFSAICITDWWYMLNKIGEVEHPSLIPLRLPWLAVLALNSYFVNGDFMQVF